MNTSDENPPSPASPDPASGLTLSEGQKLAGVFVLRREASGTPGEPIWLAHDEVLGKDVSLHFIPEAVRRDDRAMAELRAEIKRNRQLIHPGILRVYDLIEESGWAAISMDWFEGDSIASLLKARGPGGFSTGEVEPWVRQICQTLDGVHKIQIVHRNLNPANLFVDKAGKLLIAKFGVSRVIEEAKGRLRDRSSGPEPGLAYLSPQQIDGEPASKLDDVYSLGATLFELLTGTLPFQGDDLLAQIRRNTAPAVTSRRTEGVSAAWDKTISSCLAKNPPDRPQTAGAVAQSLDLAGKPPMAAPAALAAGAMAAEKLVTPAAPAPAPKPVAASPVDAAAADAEPAREKRKLPPPVTPDSSEVEPEEKSGVPEIYPDLYERRSGSGLGIAAVVALLIGIVACFVYFSRRGNPDQVTSSEPVNKAVVDAPTSTPNAAPATPVATPSPALLTGKPEAPRATPPPLIPGEPSLVDEASLTPGPGTARTSDRASNSGTQLASNNNSRKATPSPVHDSASGPAVTPAKASLPPGPPITAADLPAKQAALEKARADNAAAEKAWQEAQKKQSSAEATLF